MAVFLTGDTHGDFLRFSVRQFSIQKTLTREDYVIILGDFGGLWDDSTAERHILDELERRSFTTLFVDGNHENYSMLSQFPAEPWNGGLVQRVRPHILHLMRGSLFQLQGRSFFVLGGASSHDMTGGILQPDDPDLKQKQHILRRRGLVARVNRVSWWAEELPSTQEYDWALRTLNQANWQADFILTHCAPDSIQPLIGLEQVLEDDLTHFLEEVRQRASFEAWYFGHYHKEAVYQEKFHLLYHSIQQVL